MEYGTKEVEGIYKPPLFFSGHFYLNPSGSQVSVQGGLASGHKSGGQEDQWDKPSTVDMSCKFSSRIT